MQQQLIIIIIIIIIIITIIIIVLINYSVLSMQTSELLTPPHLIYHATYYSNNQHKAGTETPRCINNPK